MNGMLDYFRDVDGLYYSMTQINIIFLKIE
nr:MAG TPA: hypothetical protein [Bacteriophage sp.]